MSYKTLSEAAKNGILKTNYQVFPYEWDLFKQLVTPHLKKGQQFIKDKDDELLVINSNEIIARYDSYDYKLYTDIAKADFYRDQHAKTFRHLKRYLN